VSKENKPAGESRFPTPNTNSRKPETAFPHSNSHNVQRFLNVQSHISIGSFTEVALELKMVKRTATILVCLLTLSLTALADRVAPTWTDSNSPENAYYLAAGAGSDSMPFTESRPVGTGTVASTGDPDGMQDVASWGVEDNDKFNHIVVQRDPPRNFTAVPEPGSLLIFGTGLLLGFRLLKRKTSVC
jgi:hypothetical protein